MNFYSSIAEYYSDIFPFNPDQVKFTQQSFPNLKQNTILDIGCATGTLSLQLAPFCKHITGIDLDRQMIKKAEKVNLNQYNNLEFLTLDMMHVSAHFGVYAFDGILCFGNTLVHLQTPRQVLNFLSNCKAVLKNKGKLLLQIINYDRILNQKINQLPTIENNHIRFKRSYQMNAAQNRIHFKTTLKVKKNEMEMKNEIQLYPIGQKELNELLIEVGFTQINCFGDFRKSPYAKESYALVIEAT